MFLTKKAAGAMMAAVLGSDELGLVAAMDHRKETKKNFLKKQLLMEEEMKAMFLQLNKRTAVAGADGSQIASPNTSDQTVLPEQTKFDLSDEEFRTCHNLINRISELFRNSEGRVPRETFNELMTSNVWGEDENQLLRKLFKGKDPTDGQIQALEVTLMRKELDILRKDVPELSKKNVELHEKNVELEAANAELKTAKTEFENAASAFTARNAELRNQLEPLQNSFDERFRNELGTALKPLNEINSMLREKEKSLNEQLNAKNLEIEEWKKMINDLQHQVETASSHVGDDGGVFRRFPGEQGCQNNPDTVSSNAGDNDRPRQQ